MLDCMKICNCTDVRLHENMSRGNSHVAYITLHENMACENTMQKHMCELKQPLKVMSPGNNHLTCPCTPRHQLQIRDKLKVGKITYNIEFLVEATGPIYDNFTR